MPEHYRECDELVYTTAAPTSMIVYCNWNDFGDESFPVNWHNTVKHFIGLSKYFQKFVFAYSQDHRIWKHQPRFTEMINYTVK